MSLDLKFQGQAHLWAHKTTIIHINSPLVMFFVWFGASKTQIISSWINKCAVLGLCDQIVPLAWVKFDVTIWLAEAIWHTI